MFDDEDQPDPDDIMVVLEVTEDATEYRLTVRSVGGKPIDDKEFIVHMEMWLHEQTQAEIARSDSGVQIH